MEWYKKAEVRKRVNKTIKSKRIDERDKIIVVLDIYNNYFSEVIDIESKNATLENYYELFFKNKIQDEDKFNHFYVFEYENLVFFHYIEFIKLLSKYKLDTSKLQESDKVLLSQVLESKSKFNQNYDYPRFYTDNEQRKVFFKDIENFIKYFNINIPKRISSSERIFGM